MGRREVLGEDKRCLFPNTAILSEARASSVPTWLSTSTAYRKGYRVLFSITQHAASGCVVVEIILDEAPLNAVRCEVVWIGKAGSKQEDEVGQPFKRQL